MHLENSKLKDCYIQVGDVNTHYWDVGVGNIPIILVHGINSSVAFWSKNICEFAKHHRVIALDLIGFGDTDKPDVTYDLITIANFLKSFLEKLNIECCYLVGHSMGGAVCLKFAVTYTNYVAKLVLVSPAGFYRKLALSLRILAIPFIGEKLLQVSKKLIGYVMKYVVYDAKCISKELIQNTHRLVNLPRTQAALANFLKTNIDFRGIRKKEIELVAEKFYKLKMPVFVIWGKNDKVLSICGAFRAKKMLPHIKLHLIDKCGHIPQIEHPQEFNRVVNKFLM